MRPPELSATVELTVPFHDCDPLFVVWHGRYFEYLELARTALFQRLTLDVPDIRDMGFRMYITDARCRYLSPLGYGDSVRVTARLAALEPLVRVTYEVFNLTRSRKSARAFTELATTDAAGNLLTTAPEPIRARFAAALERGDQ
ncbi:MAG: acyl-CoA thioesterase [Myxococcales bacterium]|nr:acyl-CoA thioesterase [Myxococcales bacterium]MCB9520176.1 acyl-CoA thioesterase [Myxococcales bacterium]MCB9531202.1 acyl-CoA thioesterase [Myxococcales bacterium]